MPSMTKISIIIAAYNEEKFIANCLNSLLKQSYPIQEIIVVDDGSTDKTWEILNQLKRLDSKIKIYRKKHLEQATARNYGFKKSTGDILVFPDADYYFDLRFVEKLIAPIIQGKSVASFTSNEYVANIDNVWSKCWNINSFLPAGKRLSLRGLEKCNNLRAIKRWAFVKAGGFSETGYTNDVTVLDKLNMPEGSFRAKGAICYHYNPYSLVKVFKSARRMASKGGIIPNLKNILIFSPINSLRNGLVRSLTNKKPSFFLFKLVYDFGVLVGFGEYFFKKVTSEKI